MCEKVDERTAKVKDSRQCFLVVNRFHPIVTTILKSIVPALSGKTPTSSLTINKFTQKPALSRDWLEIVAFLGQSILHTYKKYENCC